MSSLDILCWYTKWHQHELDKGIPAPSLISSPITAIGKWWREEIKVEKSFRGQTFTSWSL
jgi:hypothetical protein